MISWNRAYIKRLQRRPRLTPLDLVRVRDEEANHWYYDIVHQIGAHVQHPKACRYEVIFSTDKGSESSQY